MITRACVIRTDLATGGLSWQCAVGQTKINRDCLLVHFHYLLFVLLVTQQCLLAFAVWTHSHRREIICLKDRRCYLEDDDC